MTLKVGTVVNCPLCLKDQLESTKELLGGEQLKNAEWKSLGFDMDGSIRMGCHSCATLWYRQHPVTKKSQIHTKDQGWVSLEFNKPTAPAKPIIITGPSTLQ